ncbi:MAG: hypothetical protein NTW91_05200 [Verrucomicrobia bacterium]|jgi:hypothetical protein|nr:hypothetical protein [Verrucomicrobiota bacterium]
MILHSFRAFAFLALSIVPCGIASAAEAGEEIGVFTDALDGWTYNGGWEFKGANGRASRIPDQGHNAPGAVRLSAEFAAGSSYVALTRRVDPMPLGELKFWVKPEGITGLDIRLTDSGEQTFQYEVRLEGGDEWQEITISPLTDSPKSHWGGLNDGKWGGEARVVWIMLSRRFCKDGAAGACLIDDIRLVPGK